MHAQVYNIIYEISCCFWHLDLCSCLSTVVLPVQCKLHLNKWADRVQEKPMAVQHFLRVINLFYDNVAEVVDAAGDDIHGRCRENLAVSL